MSPFAYNDGKWHINESMNIVNTPDGKLLCGKDIDRMWRTNFNIPETIKATLTVKFKMLSKSLNDQLINIAYITNETTGQQFQWHPEDEDELVEDEAEGHFISEWLIEVRNELRSQCEAKAKDCDEDPQAMD